MIGFNPQVTQNLTGTGPAPKACGKCGQQSQGVYDKVSLSADDSGKVLVPFKPSIDINIPSPLPFSMSVAIPFPMPFGMPFGMPMPMMPFGMPVTMPWGASSPCQGCSAGGGKSSAPSKPPVNSGGGKYSSPSKPPVSGGGKYSSPSKPPVSSGGKNSTPSKPPVSSGGKNSTPSKPPVSSGKNSGLTQYNIADNSVNTNSGLKDTMQSWKNTI